MAGVDQNRAVGRASQVSLQLRAGAVRRGSRACSRSLNGWVLPVAILRRSDRNSTQREYLYVASRDFTLGLDRKSTRLNSSHVEISYAVFCLKKKKIQR